LSSGEANVAVGSKPEVATPPSYFCFAPMNGHWSLDYQARPLLDNRQNRAVPAVGPCPSYYVAKERVALTPSIGAESRRFVLSSGSPLQCKSLAICLNYDGCILGENDNSAAVDPPS
jgi:hypothetical protein